jgi:hypothetical protein
LTPTPPGYGGAGTISGALKGNGSGVVSQAASSDLSDATAWTAYTPTMACSNGAGTWINKFGRYKVLANKPVHITVTATLSALGSCTAGFTFTNPEYRRQPRRRLPSRRTSNRNGGKSVVGRHRSEWDGDFRHRE